jgi:thiol-disulfide isomerase/thioredoxin
MKKPWTILIWMIPVALLLYSFFMFKRAARPPLPPFYLLMLDSTTRFNTNDIPKGKPSVLIFFSPDCDHCQRETESILKNMDSLRNVNLFFITVDPFDRMKLFNEVYKLSRYPNIVVGRDYGFFFPYHFKDAQPPYNAIYDSHKRMEAILPSEADAHKLLSYLNKL